MYIKDIKAILAIIAEKKILYFICNFISKFEELSHIRFYKPRFETSKNWGWIILKFKTSI